MLSGRKFSFAMKTDTRAAENLFSASFFTTHGAASVKLGKVSQILENMAHGLLA
jgi:hypothetical protein